MLERDTVSRTVVSGAVQVIAIVVLGLVTAAVVTTFAGELASAQLLASSAGALATVVLAALVGWYATSAAETTERSRKLQRRPYVKRIVADGIDRVLRWLDDSKRRWSVSSPPMGMPVYPELDDVDVAEDVVADIARDYPETVERVSEYLTASRQYREAWTELHADLDDEIRNGFELSDTPETIQAVVPDRYDELDPGEEVDPWQDPTEFVAEHSETFARLVLTNPSVALNGASYLGTDEYAKLLFDARREEFIDLRGSDAVADQIDALHRHLADLKDQQDEIEEQLQQARADYVEEYDILETELGEIKNGGRTAL